MYSKGKAFSVECIVRKEKIRVQEPEIRIKILYSITYMVKKIVMCNM